MTDNSGAFTRMAARIEHNTDSTFGGAAVIMPPKEGGEAVELLVLDAKGDPAQFWGVLLTRAQMEVGRLEEKNRLRHAQGFEVR